MDTSKQAPKAALSISRKSNDDGPREGTPEAGRGERSGGLSRQDAVESYTMVCLCPGLCSGMLGAHWAQRQSTTADKACHLCTDSAATTRVHERCGEPGVNWTAPCLCFGFCFCYTRGASSWICYTSWRTGSGDRHHTCWNRAKGYHFSRNSSHSAVIPQIQHLFSCFYVRFWSTPQKSGTPTSHQNRLCLTPGGAGQNF